VHLYLALERPSKSGGKRACIRHVIRDPKEWHYITEPFDVREVEKLEYVTFLRDGYQYVTSIGDWDEFKKE
jgi:hypothetical protein